MDIKQKLWLDELTKDRDESARVHEKPSERGYWSSVVDKYSDQAHFVYELLQNADDAKATYARFLLRKDGLIFIHNGTTRFTVSNPACEEEDTLNKSLGHVNSICSIGNSTKTEASIGKFGVGFKAVFQYTQTPHIYDPEMRFKIERFLVPMALDTDFAEGRKDDETVFWFPFDHEAEPVDLSTLDTRKRLYFTTWKKRQKTAQMAYNDISQKLKSLVFPTLFLSNLESVSYDVGELQGEYLRVVEESVNTTAQLVSLLQRVDNNDNEQKLWLFSRTTEKDNHHYSYSIGFFLENGVIVPAKYPAFCFFPTKETTNLEFIVHAPFLLTDSRESIKVGEEWNRHLIQELANLSADSLLFLRDKKLIDDSIIDIIPYNESDFAAVNDTQKISFKPFYTAIKQKFITNDLLPIGNGEYVGAQVAYWFQDKPVRELFSNEQLPLLINQENIKWVFPGLARNQTDKAPEKRQYIDDCIVDWLDMDDALRMINGNFISRQSIPWLHSLYAYLNEYDSRRKLLRKESIFLDQDGNAVPAFEDYNGKEQPVLFLPDDDITDYKTVNKKLLSNEKTYELIAKFGITKPSLRDDIYIKILPLYQNNHAIDTNQHFIKFFRYFKECTNEQVNEFIINIKDKAFLRYKTATDEKIFRGKASDIYMPTSDMLAWFETKPDTKFLCLDDYHKLIKEKDHDHLECFFKQLGLQYTINIKQEELTSIERNNQNVPRPGGGSRDIWEQGRIDGCNEIISSVDDEKSIVIWTTLSHLCAAVGNSFNQLLQGRHKYTCNYKWKTEYFEGIETTRLRTTKWILNKNDELVSANDVTVKTLSSRYNISNSEAKLFINYLQIYDEAQDFAHLNEEQKRLINLGKLVADSGATENELKDAIATVLLRKKQMQSQPLGTSVTQGTLPADAHTLTTENEEFDNFPTSTSKVLGKITQRIKTHCENTASGFHSTRQVITTSTDMDLSDSLEIDEDEYIPRSVDYAQKIKQAEERIGDEIQSLQREQDLFDTASKVEKYSFAWFKALLELESIKSNEGTEGGKRISIAFGNIEKEQGTEKTLVLKHPNRYIPPAVEELSDIRLDLCLREMKHSVTVESLSIKGFALRAKLKSADALNGVKLADVLEARIDVQSPTFLSKALQDRFSELHFDDADNLQKKLPENIEFVFGPPGTGKTTHLANEVLLPFMRRDENLKVLVLTPTNKSADVLVKRVIESLDGDTSYINWLVRFGITGDEIIEKKHIVYDRTFNLDTLNRSVVVTTISRFFYDTFTISFGSKPLRSVQWDYIIIDEASMIPLANIVYPLYAQKPEKFIIAGDPFQIEPITAVEQWKGQNIYTLVELKSFDKNIIIPHHYAVTKLLTQYRSIPVIGEIFSKFTYNGMLQHNRTDDTHRLLTVDDIEIQPLNIIKIPVSKYESIYRPKKLKGGSNYQAYSALFTFEFIRFLVGQIQKNHANSRPFKMGIIAPYKAQADLVDKLTSSWHDIPSNVEINVGTIHSFQGDECDIVVVIFNPPPNISTSSQIFLNKQNILNVAISRAQDYLFIIMPDDETDKINSLHKIKQLESLCVASGKYKMFHSHDIEKIIFNNEHYLEDNSFSTSHQLVNVYSKPERQYEIRGEDTAVDVQIHDTILTELY